MIGASFALSCAVFAQDLEIGWAGNGLTNIVGAPNNSFVALGSTTTTSWQTPIVYNPFSMAAFLGISVSTLARADIIAIEGNGGGSPAGHFESSRWTFTNGAFTQTIDHNETSATPGPGIVAFGSLSQASYNAFFGISGTNSPVISWILLDSALDVRDPGFSLNVQQGFPFLPGEGTPDPDAIGRVVCTVPEPSSLIAAGLGIAAFVRLRRNRK